MALRRTLSSIRRLDRGILGVGAASFFSDTGHEIATAVLPSFVTSILHAGAAALGAVDGLADALMGISKLLAGPWANRPQLRGRLARSGYLGTAVTTGAIGLTTAVWQVGILRAVAWISRGLRSPARDALLASMATKENYGKAYGLERAGDNLGAVLGPLLASVLVAVAGIRVTMLVAVVPGLFAALAISVAARAALTHRTSGRELQQHVGSLRGRGLGLALLPIAAFECGNIATTLLILRASQVLAAPLHSATAATAVAIGLYAVHNAAAALSALLGGRIIDRLGSRRVFAAAALIYIGSYVLFAIGPRSVTTMALAFILAGVAIGVGEPSQSVVVANAVPESVRGSAFGVLGGIQAGGDLLATVVVGVLYTFVSPLVGFLYAALWMALSLVTGIAVRNASTA